MVAKPDVRAQPSREGQSEKAMGSGLSGDRPLLPGVGDDAWLAAVVNAADDAIISKDLSGTIISWNPGAERLFGYKAEEVIGSKVSRLIPRDRVDEEPAILDRISKGQRIDHYETFRQRKNGSLVEVSLTISPVRATDGKIVGASKIAREITDRRALEYAMRQLASIVDSADDAIISQNPEGIIQSWNPAAERLFGYTPFEAIGRSVTMLIPLRQLEEEPGILARLHNGERIEHYETVRRRKDGKLIDVSLTVSPLRDAVGQVMGASTIVRDISDRKRGGEAVRYLAAIVESSNDAIISKNLDGVIQSWNGAAERLFGYSAKEAIGRSVLMLIPEGRRDEEPAILARLRRGERIEHYETIRCRKEGTLVEVSLTVSPIRDGRGEIIGASKIVRDISMQKQAQRELNEAHAKAVAANRAKDDFLAALSHELRTPLNPVLLIASEAAANQSLPGPVRADFEAIRTNVELEARLIDDLLDLSKIVNGKLQLKVGTHDLRDILRQAAETVRPDVEAKQQILVVSPGTTPLAVSGDSVRLQQVIWNVLKNAVKFTPVKGRITLSTRINTLRSCAVIEIADTGVGIAADELDKIFDAFAQAKETSNDVHRFGGLGLGLTISRMITELHRGTIHAESKGPGTGSTFVVELPLARMEDGIQRSGSEARAADGRGPAKKSSLSKRRVLLIEDHAPSRQALSRLLTRRGYDIVGAGTMEEARIIAERERLAFAISDIGLPDGDGVELIREYKTKYGLSSIALTGYGMEDDILRCKEAGAIAHLTKPVSSAALDQALASKELRQSLSN
jgi:PAS domain S-box-containing protein